MPRHLPRATLCSQVRPIDVCALSSAPLQGFGSSSVSPNLVDGRPAARRSCVETATRQRKPPSQTKLVVVGASQRRMYPGEARELEPRMQRESVGAALEARGSDRFDALQSVIEAGAVQEQCLRRQLRVTTVVQIGLERLDE